MMNTGSNPLSNKRTLYFKDKNKNIRKIQIITYNFDKKCNVYYEEKNNKNEKQKK